MHALPYKINVPGLPSGWKVLHVHRSAQHTRDGLVLCEKIYESSESETRQQEFTEYVVWYVNFIEGGCHNGYYRMDYDAAKKFYAECIERMN